MKIRQIEKPDVGDVLRLMRRHAEIENYADIFAVNGLAIEDREKISGRPAYEILVAEDSDGLVIGYALYFILGFSFRQRPLLYLNDLMVDEGHRRRSVARALMEGLSQVARSANCFRIKWGVSASNVQAIGFYNAMGADREVNKLYFTLDEANFVL